MIRGWRLIPTKPFVYSTDVRSTDRKGEPMLKNYVKIAFKVFRRRKFFTFISLFAISFTLVVLMVAAAMFDHMFAPMAPETRQDRTLGVYSAVMFGKQFIQAGNAGYGFLS